MSNATMKKFGFPDTVVSEGNFWVLQVRPAQVTLGAMVLICKEPVNCFSQVSENAFFELKKFVALVEENLKKFLRFDKINYLMLMMVDPDVHFHIIPRYSEEQEFAGVKFQDSGWPGPPDLVKGNETNADVNQEIRRQLKEWLS